MDLNLKSSYQIASLFHMYIDMGEGITGKQDKHSLITEDPLPRAPEIANNIQFLAPPAERQRCFSNAENFRNASVTFLLFWHETSLG